MKTRCSSGAGTGENPELPTRPPDSDLLYSPRRGSRCAISRGRMRILITGGAGFVGSSIALRLRHDRPEDSIVALDNLVRRGSELALPRLSDHGVEFVHGDVRCWEDLEGLGRIDRIIDCSADPSVHAGYDGGARALIQTNLNGTAHCLELARIHGAGLIFLSTSRVYPIPGLRGLPLRTEGERLVLDGSDEAGGWSAHGVSQRFPMQGYRSIYGVTKYSSELLAQEYTAMFDMPIVINRCGVITGPWQMGKVDQGFLVLWAARHLFGGSLSYNGFGGEGHQVRDVLHVEDLCDLVSQQLASLEEHAGALYCVGGGPERSLSLRELTHHCRERSGSEIEIGTNPSSQPADIPYYVTDIRDVTARTGWQPRHSVDDILDDVFAWLSKHQRQLRPILGTTERGENS